jgi:hypothetical protein
VAAVAQRDWRLFLAKVPATDMMAAVAVAGRDILQQEAVVLEAKAAMGRPEMGQEGPITVVLVAAWEGPRLSRL